MGYNTLMDKFTNDQKAEFAMFCAINGIRFNFMAEYLAAITQYFKD